MTKAVLFSEFLTCLALFRSRDFKDLAFYTADPCITFGRGTALRPRICAIGSSKRDLAHTVTTQDVGAAHHFDWIK